MWEEYFSSGEKKGTSNRQSQPTRKEKGGQQVRLRLLGGILEIGIVVCNQDFLMAYYYFG